MSSRNPADNVEMRLLGVCSVLRGLLAGATRDEVLTRHRVGTVLCELKRAERTYGERALERAAVELGYTTPTLYRYIIVAQTWSEEQMRAVLDRTDRFGQPLSWSHFVALSRATDSDTREQLLEQCLADAWSVRELIQRVSETPEIPRRPPPAPAATTPVREALAEGIRSATRATTDVGIFADALADRLVDANGTDESELFSRAISAFDELRLRAEATLTQLQTANRLSETRVRCSLPLRVDVRPGLDPHPAALLDEMEEEEPPRAPQGARGHAPRRG